MSKYFGEHFVRLLYVSPITNNVESLGRASRDKCQQKGCKETTEKSMVKVIPLAIKNTLLENMQCLVNNLADDMSESLEVMGDKSQYTETNDTDCTATLGTNV
jgi:hypothetical protein